MIAVTAESNGVLVLLHVDDGSRVEEGERVCDIELMKTQFPLVATASGVIRFRVELGAVVGEGDVIAVIE